MSPEQAKGKSVDRRADIWAFGCVLFEMPAAHPAFGGETITDTLAAVMRGEPEWEQLPAQMPTIIHDLLYRCLVKDSRQRLQAIGEARIVLEKYLVDPNVELAVPTPVRRANRDRIFTRIAAAAVLISILLQASAI